MEAIVLAGGFAKRMGSLTRNKPKHLLPIANKVMLDYVLNHLESLSEVTSITISTNKRFREEFQRYLDNRDNEKSTFLFVEDSQSQSEKLGSIGALGHLITEKDIENELLVIGGDNIFEFGLSQLIDFYHSKKGNVIAVYDVKSFEKASLYGVVTLDIDSKIIGFQEKPKKPKSTLVSTACYAFTSNGICKVLTYLNKGYNPDDMGHFIEWLYQNDNVFGYICKGIWFDIGSIESYEEAKKYFTKK